MRLFALASLLALTASADDGGLSRLYDGAAGPAPRFDSVRPPVPAAVDALARKPTAPTPDLIAAKARLGNDAQIAKLAAAPSNGEFVFGVIGDAEPGRFPWERVFTPGLHAFADQMAALQAADPDFIVQLGDFVSEGTVDEYRAGVAWLDANARTPLLHAIGNHDRSRPNGDADKNLYDAVFGPRDYFFDRGGWRFVVLDSSDRVVTPAQIAWLAAALKSPARKAIFTHVPPMYLKPVKPLAQVGALETDADEFQAAADEGGVLRDFLTNYFDEGSADFERLVSDPASRVAAVYMGHIHAFWAADHKGVRYVISGGGGSPLYPLPPGYPKKKFAHTLTVRANARGLVETVHPLKGAPFVLPPVR